MNNWYEVKVKYDSLDAEGNEKKATEVYLFDAMTFTEAEARAIKEVASFITEFGAEGVITIKRSRYVSIYPYDSGEYWFAVKTEFVTVDEDKGKEKKVSEMVLIQADDIEQAFERIRQSMDSFVVAYVITGMNLTQVIDIFPYVEEEEIESV